MQMPAATGSPTRSRIVELCPYVTSVPVRSGSRSDLASLHYQETSSAHCRVGILAPLLLTVPRCALVADRKAGHNSENPDCSVLNEEGESRLQHRSAIVVQELPTRWFQSYSCKTKTSHVAVKSLRKFFELEEDLNVVCADKNWNLSELVQAYFWNH